MPPRRRTSNGDAPEAEPTTSSAAPSRSRASATRGPDAATAPPEFVGSALTIVNCIGFAITVVSVQVATWLSDRLPLEAWFVPVAVGPALGLFALRRLVLR